MKKTPNPIDVHVGARVRMRRMMLGLSQTDLATGLKLTFQQVQKYEKGTNRIGASRLQQISGVLHVAPAFFFEDAPGAGIATTPVPDFATGFLTTSDGLAIAKAFDRMDPKVRRRFVALAEEMTA